MGGLMEFIQGLFSGQSMPGGFSNNPSGNLLIARHQHGGIQPIDVSGSLAAAGRAPINVAQMPGREPQGLPDWVQGLNAWSQSNQEAQQQPQAPQMPQAPPIQAGQMPQAGVGQMPGGVQGRLPPYMTLAALMSQMPQRDPDRPVRTPRSLSDAMRMLAARGNPPA